MMPSSVLMVGGFLLVCVNAAPFLDSSFTVDCSLPENQVTLHPHPSSCTQYLQCVHGSPMERPCAPGTEFSATIGVCVHPWESGCTIEDEPEPEPQPEPQPEPETTGPPTSGPIDPETSSETTVTSPDITTEEPKDQTTTEQSEDQTTTEKPKDQTTGEPEDPTTTEEPEDQTTEEPEDQTTEEPEDQTTEEPEDQTTEQPEDQTTEEPEDQTTTEEPEDITTEEPEDQTTEETEDQTTEEPEDQTTEEPEDQTTTDLPNVDPENSGEGEYPNSGDYENDDLASADVSDNELQASSKQNPEDASQNELNNSNEGAEVADSDYNGLSSEDSGDDISKDDTPVPTPEEVCRGRPDRFFLLPHPTSCSSFIACTFGEAVVMQCNLGEYFNPSITTCTRDSSYCNGY